MAIVLDLWIRPLPLLQDMRSALTFCSPNMVVLGGVSSTFMLQPIAMSPALTFWKLPKAHGLPYMVIVLDLWIRPLPSP